MVKGDEIERHDAQALAVGERVHRGNDGLVHRALEADVRSIPPDPVLAVGRPPDAGHEARETRPRSRRR